MAPTHILDCQAEEGVEEAASGKGSGGLFGRGGKQRQREAEEAVQKPAAALGGLFGGGAKKA